jgi:hypothetical protein
MSEDCVQICEVRGVKLLWHRSFSRESRGARFRGPSRLKLSGALSYLTQVLSEILRSKVAACGPLVADAGCWVLGAGYFRRLLCK